MEPTLSTNPPASGASESPVPVAPSSIVASESPVPPSATPIGEPAPISGASADPSSSGSLEYPLQTTPAGPIPEPSESPVPVALPTGGPLQNPIFTQPYESPVPVANSGDSPVPPSVIPTGFPLENLVAQASESPVPIASPVPGSLEYPLQTNPDPSQSPVPVSHLETTSPVPVPDGASPVPVAGATLEYPQSTVPYESPVPVATSASSVPIPDGYALQNPVFTQTAGAQYVSPVPGGAASYVSPVPGGAPYVSPIPGGADSYVSPIPGGSDSYVSPVPGGADSYVSPVPGGAPYVSPIPGGADSYVSPVPVGNMEGVVPGITIQSTIYSATGVPIVTEIPAPYISPVPGGALTSHSPVPPSVNPTGFPLHHAAPHHHVPVIPPPQPPLRFHGLGNFSVLNDRWIIAWARTFLIDKKCLPTVSTLCLTSKAWFQFMNWEVIWKTIALLLSPGDFFFHHSWKFTCKIIHEKLYRNSKALPQLQMAGFSHESDEGSSSSASTSEEDEAYVSHYNHLISSRQQVHQNVVYPSVKLEGFHSDFMHEKWWRAQANLSDFFHETGQIPRVSRITEHDFVINYDGPRRPCVLTDIIPNWRAAWLWDMQKLASRFPDAIIKCAQYNDNMEKIKMTFAQFMTYSNENRDEKPLYIFDSGFGERLPGLLEDFKIPSYFWKDYLSVLGKRRPTYRWLVMGCARTGTGFHIDPSGTGAWNALLRGHKRWALYPPNQTPAGLKTVKFDANGKLLQFSAFSPLKWYLQIYPYLKAHEKPIEVIQRPGEMVYIPPGWWHMVLNLDTTVSVTQNFVNDQNLTMTTRVFFGYEDQKLLNLWMSKLREVNPEAYRIVKRKVTALRAVELDKKCSDLTYKLNKEKKKYQKKKESWHSFRTFLVEQVEMLTRQLQSHGIQPATSSNVPPPGWNAFTMTTGPMEFQMPPQFDTNYPTHSPVPVPHGMSPIPIPVPSPGSSSAEFPTDAAYGPVPPSFNYDIGHSPIPVPSGAQMPAHFHEFLQAGASTSSVYYTNPEFKHFQSPVPPVPGPQDSPVPVPLSVSSDSLTIVFEHPVVDSPVPVPLMPASLYDTVPMASPVPVAVETISPVPVPTVFVDASSSPVPVPVAVETISPVPTPVLADVSAVAVAVVDNLLGTNSLSSTNSPTPEPTPITASETPTDVKTENN